MINVNARSVVNKTVELEAFLLEHSPDIVTISETWLSCDVCSSHTFPPGYVVLRKDRCTRGGGVAILVRDNVPVTPMPDVDGIEALWCKVTIGKFSIYVGTMYRPPGAGSDALHVLNEYMQRHLHDSKKIILTGDYNLPGLE